MKIFRSQVAVMGWASAISVMSQETIAVLSLLATLAAGFAPVLISALAKRKEIVRVIIKPNDFALLLPLKDEMWSYTFRRRSDGSSLKQDFAEKLQRTSQAKSYWEIDIHNEGTKTAEECSLYVDLFSNVYELHKQGETHSGYGDKPINLGNIRPDETVRIKLWSNTSVEYLNFEKKFYLYSKDRHNVVIKHIPHEKPNAYIYIKLDRNIIKGIFSVIRPIIIINGLLYFGIYLYKIYAGS